MPHDVQAGLLKCAVPLATILVILLVVRGRKVSDGELGLTRPVWREAPLWFGLYLAWMLGTDAVMGWRGPWDFAPWRAMTPLGAGLRVAAVGLLGPIAEELLWRGVALALLLRRTRLGAGAAITLVAVVWAALHYSYTPGVIAVIAVGGILLGLARLRTRSIYVPIAMHIGWNLYAVW